MRRVVRKHGNGDYRRRANALLLLHEGLTVSAVARVLQASRKSIREWRARYQRFGERKERGQVLNLEFSWKML